MQRLARAGNRVIFVNSISMGLPSLRSPDLLPKIKRKLASYSKLVRKTEDGVIVVSPILLPSYSTRFLRSVNDWLLRIQMNLLMIAFDMTQPILWIAIPTAVGMAGRLREKLLIYQVSDKYDANRMDHAVSGSLIGRMHEELLSRADLIYYSGRKVFEEETRARPEVEKKARMLEQAVDFDHFAAATSRPWSPPEDIAAIPRPRLGYFGAVESWLLDQKLIRYVSAKRPDWHWVLLGLKGARLEVEDLLNVHHLGSKPYSEVPRYAAEFDVCVLPWVTNNEFVNYGSAIKVREYLATGKPVVITPLYEYEPLDGVLRISRSYDDFIDKVQDALSNDNLGNRSARQDAVRQSTWDVRTEQVSTDIELLIRKVKVPDESNEESH